MKMLHSLSILLMLLVACSKNSSEQTPSTKISTVTVSQESNYTGRGNDNEVILKVKVIATGSNSSFDLKNIVINMDGTSDINDVEAIKVYATGSIDFFDTKKPSTSLIGKANPAKGNISISTTGKMQNGMNIFWVTYKLKENAVEGNAVDASVLSITTPSETYTVTGGNPTGNRIILLARTQVFGPGDFGSTNYRIPAIATATDGSLVTLTDKRKYNSTDLPEDIDIVARRSTDGGKTWSEPVMVAQGLGRNAGYGDAVIIKAKSGKLIAVFVGGVGLWASTAANPIRTYVSTSSDNGITWTPSRDITNQIFGAGCADPIRKQWKASFCGSGHGLCTRSGRIMVVGAVVEPNLGNSLQNYAYYSDDEGETWKVSSRAIAGGDEAKVVELNNGDILMSSRISGNRLWAKSSDGGVTWGQRNSWADIWGNACNGDIIRYTSTLDGHSKNRLLHTLPNDATRKNVTVFLSYDEGQTWPIKKTLCAGTSAYSSLTVLPDGTIGAYIEEDESIPYRMVFVNFSLKWLTNGADAY